MKMKSFPLLAIFVVFVDAMKSISDSSLSRE